MKKAVVLAGNHKQFKQWLEENMYNEKDYIYVTDKQSILGVRDIRLIRIGTWFERSNLFELLTELRARYVYDDK